MTPCERVPVVAASVSCLSFFVPYFSFSFGTPAGSAFFTFLNKSLELGVEEHFYIFTSLGDIFIGQFHCKL